MTLPRDPHQTRPAPRAADPDPGEAPVLPGGTAAARPAPPTQQFLTQDDQHVHLSQRQLNYQAQHQAARRQAAITDCRKFLAAYQDLPAVKDVILAITRVLGRAGEPLA